jgi:AraC-like DNA-binding protein
MQEGINAASQRWTGSLIKQDFLHTSEHQDSLHQAISSHYLELSFEHATKDYYWDEHLHDNTEIIFVRKGLYSTALNDHELELPPGHVLIVGPGNRHADFCRPPLEYHAVRFDIHQVADGYPIHILRNHLAPERHVHAIGDKIILKTLDALVREEQRSSPFAYPLQQALAQELLWRVLNDLPETILNPLLAKRTRESELLVRLTHLFEKHASKPLKVKDLAEALHMSESTLAHTCTGLLGVSPAKAFTRYRLEKAARMLRSSNLSVKEIATKLGFHDESHFIHSFQKEHHTTPGAFRSTASL